MITLFPVISLVVFLMVGVPIAFSLAGAGILGIWLITEDFNAMMGILLTAPFSTVSQFSLTTIPMFILMAYFAAAGGLATDLYDGASKWFSTIRGGLAIATVFACAIFGAMSGVSLAAAAAMSKIAMPNMKRFGYSESLAAGTIAVGSTIAMLIPPSIGMVVYGIMTETSISKLLIAGIIPGIILGVLLSMVIMLWVKLRPDHAPETLRYSWKERWKSTLNIWPCLFLIVFLLIFLYTGIATPTEVGAIGASTAVLMGSVLRRLSLSDLVKSLKSTVSTSAMIFMILIGGTIFGYYIALSQVPQHIISVVTDMNLNRWIVISLIIIGYFIVSMFMDELPLMLITLQITFPLIISLDFDPIWYGVLMTMMVAMGLIFPPVGMLAFVVCSAAEVDLIKTYKGTSVMIIAIFMTTILMMVFPEIATWLPSKMK